MKVLIAYFSRAGRNYVGGRIVNLPVGNTEVAASMILKLTGGEMFRIETVSEYPTDYEEATQVAEQELRLDARPELTRRVDDMSGYGLIILGYPNWWGTMPMAVFSFLEAYDFSDKMILPFCTHEGSGMGRGEDDIKRLCPGARVPRGLAIRGGSVRTAEPEISRWLKTSGVIE